jgi:hypothetical protein
VAFVLAAAATVISMFWQHDIFSDIILTKFVRFNIIDGKHYISPSMDGFMASGDKTRVTAFSLYTTKEEIHKLRHKWRCRPDNSTSSIDVWGPDSMCRCLRQYVAPNSDKPHPTTDDTPQAVEQTCSREVVPMYGKEHAGSIRGYWNFYIGILMIHISILFSMKSVEYDSDRDEANNPSEPVQAGQSEPPPSRKLPETPGGQRTARDALYEPDSSTPEIYARRRELEPIREERQEPRFSGNNQQGAYDRNDSQLKFSLATAFDWSRDVDTSDNVYMQVGVPNSDKPQTRLLMFWDFLIVALSVVVIGFVSAVLGGTNEFVAYKIGGSSTVLYIWALVITAYTVCSIMLLRWRSMTERPSPRVHDESTAKNLDVSTEDKTTGILLRHYIELCVLQDLNYITGFMFVISTFSAQSGEHDDRIIFLDVVCVLFVGFMQHLSHMSMLLKEQAIGLCEDQMKKKLADAPESQATESIRGPHYEARMMDYIFQFFSTTRAFIFAIIGISVYIFSVRMGPTVFGQDAIANWNASARLFTLLFFVSPSILYDLYYELVHFDHMRRYQRHLQYFGPQVWRIWGGIAFILVLSLMTLQGYGGDDNMEYKMNRFLGGIDPDSN